MATKCENCDRLLGALANIAEARGRFSRNPLTYAENTIKDMVEIAQTALIPPPGKPGARSDARAPGGGETDDA